MRNTLMKENPSVTGQTETGDCDVDYGSGAAINNSSLSTIMEEKSLVCRYDGKLVYYRLGFDGTERPTVILLNAYGISIDAWRFVVESMEKTYNVILWECRGLEAIGFRNNELVFGVEEQAVDILEIMEAEGIEIAHFVAWCSGSKPAMVFQAQETNRVASITCIAPNFTPFNFSGDVDTDNASKWNSTWDTNVLAAADLLEVSPGAAGFFIDAIKTSITARINGETPTTEGRFGLLKLIGSDNVHLVQKPFMEAESLVNYFKMMKEYLCYDMKETMGNVLCPVHFFISNDDTISNPEQSRELSSLYNQVDVTEIDNGSHFMMLKNGSEFSECVRLHIDSIEK